MAALSVACRRLFDPPPPAITCPHLPVAFQRARTIVLRGHPVALRQEEAHGCAQRSSGHQDGARPPLLRARPALVGGRLASRGTDQAPRGKHQNVRPLPGEM